MKTTVKQSLLLIVILLFIGSASWARGLDGGSYPPQLPVTISGEETVGTPWTGEPGIKETVREIMSRQRIEDAFIGPPPPHAQIEPGSLDPESLLPNPDAPAISAWPPRAQDTPGAAEAVPNAQNPQIPGTSFMGAQYSDTIGYVPPDSMGAVGPDQVMVVVNGRIKVYDKSGVLGGLNVTTDTFFSSVRSASTSDPHVRYDRLSGRWFVSMIDVASVNRILLAVSSGPHITSSSSFTFFQFEHDLVGTTPNSDTGCFADYDTLGVDANAVYIGVNLFCSKYVGSTGFVIQKASVLGAGPIVVTPFRQIATQSGGCYTPQGVDNDDPAAAYGFFVGVDSGYYGLLNVYRIGNPGGSTPTISSRYQITTPSMYGPLPVPYSPTKGKKSLDALDHRLFAAAIHTNKISGTYSLWTAHSVRVNNSGVSDSSGDRDGSRWYEIGTLTTTPSLLQAGTLYDSSSTPEWYWMPSVALSGQGHMALGCSRSNSSTSPGVATAGRFRTDASGTIQSPTLVQPGSGSSYAPSFDSSPYRWGDYSQVTVDPNDDMTMWTFQEYVNNTNSWAVQAVQLKAPQPATPSAAAPNSFCVSGSPLTTDVTITGTSVGGSEFFDPGPDSGGPGFANRISATVSGSGVTVNNVTFTDPTHITVNLTISSSASGSYSVTVTNPDGQQATGSNLFSVTQLETTGADFCAGDKTCMSWSGVSGAESYSLYRGDPSELPNLLTDSTNACLRWGPNAATTTGTGVLTDTPSAGSFYWYLVVAQTGSCQGSPGSATGGTRIINSSGACP